MQRRDAVIGGLGALLVVAATVGVGFAGPPSRALFEVTYPLAMAHVGEGSLAHLNEAGFTDAFTLDVTTNASALFVNATVDFLGAPQASARATLTAPNGTAYEAEGVLSGTANAQRLTMTFAVDLAKPPAPRRVEGAPPADPAEDQAWILEVGFTTGAPLPSPSATTAWSADALAWRAEVVPVVPDAR